MGYNAVFDIGGNGVQWEIYSKKEVINEGEFSTVDKDKAFVINELGKIINKFKEIENIGIATPCALNPKTGFLAGISGIKNWCNFNLYDELRAILKNKEIRIFAANDANAALLGSTLEHPQIKNAVQITIGTGLGGAVLIDGKIFVGNKGYVGEFGFFPFRDKNNEVVLASEILSSNALVKRLNNKYDNVKQIYDEYKMNQKEIKEWIYDLALFIYGLNYSFDPEHIFISGGVTKNELFKKDLLETIIFISKKNKEFELAPSILFSNFKNAGLSGTKKLIIDSIMIK